MATDKSGVSSEIRQQFSKEIPAGEDAEKFTNALEQAQKEILDRKSKETDKQQAEGKQENSTGVIPQSLDSAGLEFPATANTDLVGDLHKQILDRALEILQGDKSIDTKSSKDAFDLTEALEAGDLKDIQ